MEVGLRVLPGFFPVLDHPSVSFLAQRDIFAPESLSPFYAPSPRILKGALCLIAQHVSRAITVLQCMIMHFALSILGRRQVKSLAVTYHAHLGLFVQEMAKWNVLFAPPDYLL